MDVRELKPFKGPHYFRAEGVARGSQCWRYAISLPGLGIWGVDVWIDLTRRSADVILERVPGSSAIHNHLLGKRRNPTAFAQPGQF